MRTLTTRGEVTCAVSPSSLSRPPDQNHHLTESFSAIVRLACFRPSFSLHRLSRSALFPLSVHHTLLASPGPTSPRSSRRLYASAFAQRAS
jgi:hypothetical protein